MAFPFLSSKSFEAGSSAEWDSETDTDSKLDFMHYSDMARVTSADGNAEVPYDGAYAMHINLATGTADAIVTETGDNDMAADDTDFISFALYVTENLVMAASDRFTILSLDSAGPTSEAVIDIRNNAGTIEILAAETGASATVRAATLTLGQWHLVELRVNLDSGGGNDGTLDFYLDGSQVSTQLGSLDQEVTTQLRLGAIGIDVGTTAGHLFFDMYQVDDERIRPTQYRRFDTNRWKTHSGHPALGHGKAMVSLTGTGTNAVINLYDTDQGNLNEFARLIRVIRNVSANEFIGPIGDIEFTRGLYCELTGTSAQAWVDLLENPYNSRAGRVNLAFGRTPRT